MKRRIDSYFMPCQKKQKEDDTSTLDYSEREEAVNSQSDEFQRNSDLESENEAASAAEKSDSASTESRTETKRKKKFAHRFQRSWIEKFNWLRYEGGKMFCDVCQQAKKENSLTVGSDNFRTSTLVRHLCSTDHKQAVRDSLLRRDFSVAADNLISQKEEAIGCAMSCVYWLAKEGLPIAKYPSLIKFMKLKQCPALGNLEQGKNATYSSRTTANEMLEAITDTIEKEVNRKIQKSMFYSVVIDESTDIKVTKKLVIFAKTVDDNNLQQETHFLGNVPFTESSATAEVIFAKLRSHLEARGLEMGHIYAFGSDGASTMVGRNTGVATRLRELSPHLINVHCLAHRLALCTENAANYVPFIKAFQQTLTDLFYYFKKSANRTAALAGIQKVLDSEQVKLKEVHEVRWFAFYDALHSVFLNWKSLVTYFKGLKKPNEKEKEMLQKLTDYRFVAVLHMLMDVIPSFTQLNIIFQQQNLDVAVVQPAIDSTLEACKHAREGKTHFNRMFKEQLKKTKEGHHTFKGVQLQNKNISKAVSEARDIFSSFLTRLEENVARRFPKESTELALAFQVDTELICNDYICNYYENSAVILFSW